MPIKKLKLSTILTDQGTDVRAQINDDIVTAYGTAANEKAKFPPLVVFELPDDTIVLADGFHRFYGFERQGIKEYDCDVRKGTKDDAILFALGCNETHGYRRTQADKRNAVEMAMTKWPKNSDGKIATICNVSRQYVSQGGFREWQKEQQEENAKQAAKQAAGEAVVIPPRKSSNPPPRPNGRPVSASNPPPRPADSESQEPTTPESNTMDATGIQVPEEIIPYWDMSLTEGSRLMNFISEVRVRLKRAQDTNEPMFRELLVQGGAMNDTIAKLDLVYASLKLVKPYAVCAECQGVGKISKDCQCRGRGFVSQFYWDNCVAEETKTLTGRE